MKKGKDEYGGDKWHCVKERLSNLLEEEILQNPAIITTQTQRYLP